MRIEYSTLSSVTVMLKYTGIFVNVQNLCLAVQNGSCIQVIHAKGNINFIKIYNIVILCTVLYACDTRTFILKRKNTYCVCKNNVLCRMFDPKRLKNKENSITAYSKVSD
jgi:hypothetical protein